MNSQPVDRDPVEQLAEEFLDRYRRGDRACLSEYAARYPDLAEQIRELFPALVVLEELGSVADSAGPGKPSAMAAVPEQLGEYRILREVGRGGMGIVYEAVQESLGRHVALKVLPFSALAGPTHLERFQREAKAAARLSHPNIVSVFGVGEHGGLHYYAMQFISGQGLDLVLRELTQLRRVAPANAAAAEQEPTRVRAATAACDSSGLASQTVMQYYRSVARLGVQVAQALEYAHQHGVLHRDIKPSNLLLDAQGEVWVTDFGLALVEGSEQLTHTGDMVGTLRYMAPERLQGCSGPQNDVYSLGATLYEMLTLRPAYSETDRAQLMQCLTQQEPPRPRRLDPGIPRDLETIVLKAMAKDPADRYRGAGVMAEDLQRFCADRPIRARRAPLVERGWRWCRRNPRQTGALLLAAVMLVLLAGGIRLAASRQQEQRLEVLLAQVESSERPRTERLALIDEAAALLAEIQPDETRRRRLRNACIAALSQAELRVCWRGQGQASSQCGVAFSPQLDRYAINEVDQTVSVRRAEDHRQLVRLPGTTRTACTLVFSPDARYLAAEHFGRLWVWDCEHAQAALDELPLLVNGQPDFSPDSRCVAIPRADGVTAIYDLRQRRRVREFAARARVNYVYLAFDPAGRRFAIARAKGDVEVMDLTAAAATVGVTLAAPAAPGSTDEVRGLAWSPAGELLAVARGERIHLWEVATQSQRGFLEGHTKQVRELVFSPDGRLLASKSVDGTVRLWEVASGREKARYEHLRHAGCAPLSFTADGTRLGSGWDGTHFLLWEVQAAPEFQTLSLPAAGLPEATTCSFSPDGKLLTTLDAGQVLLWDWARGKVVARAGVKECWATHFTADGQELLLSGGSGIHRWPFGRGEPVALVAGRPLRQSSFSRTGERVLACSRGDKSGLALLYDLSNGQELLRLPEEAHPRLESVALSPDGRWLTTGSWNGSDVHIMEAASGKLRQTLSIPSSARVCFSPDQRWLVTTAGDDAQFWEVESWKLRHTVPIQTGNYPGMIAFSQDGALAALQYSPTKVLLLDGEARVRAEVSLPVKEALAWLCLSPNGRSLAVGCRSAAVHIWDLELIRRQLGERGLDW